MITPGADDAFLASAGSMLTATSETNIPGTVVIDAAQPALVEQLTTLPKDFIDAAL